MSGVGVETCGKGEQGIMITREYVPGGATGGGVEVSGGGGRGGRIGDRYPERYGTLTGGDIIIENDSI